MNFSELQSEFFARGFDYLSEDFNGTMRAQRWLNQAYVEICNLQAWPFLQKNAFGNPGAPYVSVPDLRKILLVSNIEAGTTPGTVLRGAQMEELVTQYGIADLSNRGTPFAYYVANGTEVTPYPVGGTLYVRYIKRPTELTGFASPLFAPEYHNLIVDRAVSRAYVDSDNFEAAAAMDARWTQDIQSMVEDYQLESNEHDYIDVGEPYDG